MAGRVTGLGIGACTLAIITTMGAAAPASASATAWLRFDAAWETALNTAASDAGVTSFSGGEIDTIEAAVLDELERIYAGYDITFVASASDPGGTREFIDFAASLGSGTLGSAGLDFGNLSTGQTINVATANFGFILDEFSGSNSRATQINQISTAVAGTAAHELLHSFGARHTAAYGTNGITNANYNNTGGLQNQHIIATASTGLGEAGRESQRTLSTWERAILDVAGRIGVGGGTAITTGTNQYGVSENSGVGDFGNSAGTAFSINSSLVTGPTSGLDLAVITGDLDSTDNDADWFSVTITQPTLLSAEVWSLDRWNPDFDSFLQIFDTDGASLIASAGTNEYSGNVFGSGGNGTEDPFLVNVSLASAGTYYIALTVEDLNEADAGDFYSVMFGLTTVPEPATSAIASFAGLSLLISRRRKR